MSNIQKEENNNQTRSDHAIAFQIPDHMTDDQKIDFAAAYILNKYRSAFEKLAKNN